MPKQIDHYNPPSNHGNLYLRREFLPVGQGAFYFEEFRGVMGRAPAISVVYDCGTRSFKDEERRNLLIGRLVHGCNFPSEFSIIKTIHAIFISHFHEDHFNGLPALLKFCDVKCIYLPAIDPMSKSLMKLWFKAMQISGFAYQFLDNPRKAVDSLGANVKLIAVGSQDIASEVEGAGLDFHLNGQPIKLSDFEASRGMSEGNPFHDWIFVPFNLQRDKFVAKLKCVLQGMFPQLFASKRPLSNSGMDKLCRDEINRNKVINAYKVAAGSSTEVNTNSMVFFSGIQGDGLRQTLHQWCRDNWKVNVQFRNVPPGCLFTGDYNASGRKAWKEFVHFYSDYRSYVGCVQIPHHGSKISFNQRFLSEFPKDVIYVISARRNSTRHPSKYVKNQFAAAKKQHFVVTEEIESWLTLCVQ